ncbi:ankyrin repeat domain-containing protein, partial [Xanthomonas citri]
MTEPVRGARMRAAALAGAAGVVLCLLGGIGGAVAALSLWLAQPAFALAVSWARGTRAVPGQPRAIAQALPPLLAIWGVGLLALAALISWPLTALRDSGSLAAALALSVAVSAALLGLWRTWPLWGEVERDGGALAPRWQALAAQELHAWRGLLAAALVLAMCTLAVVLAWPGWLSGGLRWGLAVAACVLLPVAHLLLQRTPAPMRSDVPQTRQAADFFSEAAAEPRPLEPVAQHQLVPELFEAARSGRVDRALQLLEAGADPQALPLPEWRDQRSLPALAAVLPDLRLLRELIVRRVDVNQPHRGMTPLLAATRDSWHGRPDAVMTLLANGADPRASDNDGNTPLHHAVRSSDPGVAALLRDAAAELDALNNEGHSPLAMACQVGNWRLAKFLLERGAQSEPEGGAPVLLAAAGTEEDDPAGVQLLLKHKARVDARDRQRRSALHEAALAGHGDIVEALLSAGANLEARDLLGRTPWLDAARQARSAVLERLVARKADVLAIDGDGRNALMLACAADNVSPALIR